MKLFRSNDPIYRLLRTILQGICGIVIANLDLLVGYIPITIPDALRPVIVALIMAILSPVMAAIGKEGEGNE